MRSFLQFIVPWGSYIAFSFASFAILLWLMSIDDNSRDEKVASSMLWSIFWPVLWFYYRLVGKEEVLAGRRARREQAKQVFKTIREAKDYLAIRIVDEAQLVGTPLTDVERKMLYFTETGWTLPDMKKVSAEFDRNYDQSEYERKIGQLVARIQARLSVQRQQEQKLWELALEKLSRGDHYLLVLVDAPQPARKGLRHNVKMLYIGLVFLAIAALDIYFRRWMRNH